MFFCLLQSSDCAPTFVSQFVHPSMFICYNNIQLSAAAFSPASKLTKDAGSCSKLPDSTDQPRFQL